MTDELVAAVERAVVAHETARRLGRGAPLLQVPEDPRWPPLVELAHRPFPAGLLQRRLRVVRALGWTDLPDIASVADHLAVHGLPAEPDGVDERAWDERFDRLADEQCPGWRHRRVDAAAFARLEALTCDADALFGRRRGLSSWGVWRRAARRAGEVKRRWRP